MNSDVGGTLKYIITADTQDFTKALKSASSQFDEFAGKLNKAGAKTGKSLEEGISDGTSKSAKAFRKFVDDSIGALGELTSALGSVAFNSFTTAAGAASTALTTMVSKGLTDADSLQKMNAQIIGLANSTNDANSAMSASVKFFKQNPFQRFETIEATKNLMMYDKSIADANTGSAKLTETLDMLGVASLSTGTGIAELAQQWGEISNSSRVQVGQLDEFAMRVPAIWDAIGKKIGKKAAEVREELKGVGISGDIVVEAMKSLYGLDTTKLNLDKNSKEFKEYFNSLTGAARQSAEAYLAFNNTMSRQTDRVKGRLADMRQAIIGYTLNAEEGFVAMEGGIYQSAINLMKVFANLLTGSTETGKKFMAGLQKIGNAIAPLIDKLTAKLPEIIDKVGDALNYIGDHIGTLLPILGGGLVMFGKLGAGLPGIGGIISNLSGSIGSLGKAFKKLFEVNPMLGIFVSILSIGLPQALKDESFRGALKSILESLMKIGQVLAPVVAEFAKFAATVGSSILITALNILAPLLKLVADALNAIPTPVLTALVTAIGGFITLKKVSPILSSLTKGFKLFGSIPTKPIEKVGSAIGKFIVGTFKVLGNNIAIIAKGAGAVLLVGAAIGGFIGLVGGGIWVLGKGLEAVGNGFKSLAEGIGELNGADASRIPEVIRDLAEALGGLFWKMGDFAVAAGTFEGIGKGLQEIALGLTAMRDVRPKDFEKLKPLAEGLKHFCYTTLNLPFVKTENVLTHFKDLGDAITNIAELCNLIANIKVKDDKLVNTMTALSNGLKSFLIAELRPSWFERVFGRGDIKVKSVTDYMGTLGSIIEPMNKLQTLVSGYNFNADKFRYALENIAEALKAFLIVEVKPSWINKVFGNYSEVNIKSVTDYLGSLGGIIEPLNKLNDMVKDADFKADEFTSFLSNLGESLKAFLTYDIEEKVSGFWGLIEGSTKIETKAVLDYFDKFGAVISALKEIQPLAKDTENLKASDFTEFVKNIGESLKAFLTYDLEATYSQFLGVSYTFKKTTRGVLEFMDNLKPTVEALGKLSELAKSYKDSSSRNDFVKFVKNIGESLRAFVIYDLEGSYSEFLGVSKTIKLTSKSVLQGFENFGTLVAGLKEVGDLLKSFGKDIDPDDFTKFVKNVGDALQSFNYFDTYSETSGWGFKSISKTETKSLLTSLQNFSELGKGLQEIGKVFKDTELKPNDYTKFLTSLGLVLKLSTFKTKESKEISDWFSSNKSEKEWDSVFNHLAHFKDFADSLGTLLQIQDLGDNKVSKIRKLITNLARTLNATVRIFSKEYSDEEGGIGYSSKKNYKAQYDTVFNHLSGFKGFADSLQTLLTIQELGDDKVEKLHGFIVDLAETLNNSVFITGDEYENTYKKFMNEEQTTKYKSQRDSIFNHLAHFSTFADGISKLLNISNTITDTQLENLKSFVADLGEALFASVFSTNSESSAEASLLWNIASGKTDAKSEYDSVFSHMEHFESFANGIVTIMNAISSTEFNRELFTSTIQSIFGALNDLMLEQTKTEESNSSWFHSESSTSETSFTSIMEYLGDVEKLAGVISTLVNNVGIGVNGGQVGDGSLFKKALTNISAGFKQIGDDWSEVAWENIDTDVLNNLVTFLGNFKNTMNEWDTTALSEQATNITSFFSAFITTFSNTEQIASVVENAKLLGTQLIDTVVEGIFSKKEEFISKVQEFITTNIPTGFLNSKETLITSTQTDIMDQIFTKMTEEANMNTLKEIGGKIVEAIRNGFPTKYEVLKQGVDGIVETISAKFYEYTNPGGRFDNIGGYIIDGLSRGMNSKKQTLLDTADRIADSIATKIETAMAVSSPSRRMFAIGEYISEGLAEGMLSQYDYVGKAAEGLADVIREPFDELNGLSVNIAGQAGNANGGSQYNKTLTVNQNNTINNDMDYNVMMADLRWQLFTA